MDNEVKKAPQRTLKLWVKIILNLLIMLVVFIGLLWGSAYFLDAWTDHGKFAVVPDVKGLPYDKAVDALQAEGFTAEISDSVYNQKLKPGMVADQVPKENAKIKYGRVVYLTVNAFTTRSVSIPDLTDTSLRQAQSVLNGLGLNNIKVVEVPSEYNNLVLAVKHKGRFLKPGTRVPITDQITLEVGKGIEVNLDSLEYID